jgi:hypothetical protein
MNWQIFICGLAFFVLCYLSLFSQNEAPSVNHPIFASY